MPFARAAVDSFKLQTYPHRKLLIINTGPVGIIQENDPGITEYPFHQDDECTLGDLRNLAFDQADSDYLLQWDDDDWYHPDRMEYQVAQLKNKGDSVFLTRQIRYSFANDSAYVYKAGPIHGTVLHPRNIRQRYPSLKRAEDTVFMKVLPNKVCADNDPILYIRFSHGANTWDEQHIMRRAAAEDVRGQRLGFEPFPPETEVYLEKVLKEHYSWRD